MDRLGLLRTASRHRIMLLAVLGLSVAGSFTQNATRALFLLPGQPPAAFAAVVEPIGSGIGGNEFGGGPRARRLIPRRGGPGGGPLGATPPPAAAGAPGVGLEQLRPEGAPDTLQNVSDPAGGGGGGPGGNGFVPGTAPLVGGGGGAGPGSTETPPVEITPAVPEPPAWALGLGGLVLLGAARQLRGRYRRVMVAA